MVIAERLRQLREEKKFSQGDIEKKTGLLRCYISRVENGHTVPSILTLEKMARALEIPMYQLFVDVNQQISIPQTLKSAKSGPKLWGSAPKDVRTLAKFCRLLGKISVNDRGILLHTAQQMQRR